MSHFEADPTQNSVKTSTDLRGLSLPQKGGMTVSALNAEQRFDRALVLIDEARAELRQDPRFRAHLSSLETSELYLLLDNARGKAENSYFSVVDAAAKGSPRDLRIGVNVAPGSAGFLDDLINAPEIHSERTNANRKKLAAYILAAEYQLTHFGEKDFQKKAKELRDEFLTAKK